MDPRAAQVAMEQMRKMSPDQMQEMMRTVQANPAMMQQAMSQMKNMRTEDWERAQEQLGSMSAEDIQRQAAQAAQHMSSQQQYVLSASKQLKAEGNTLHNAGQYKAAAEKYERARDNVKDGTAAEELELRRSCILNLSSCYLNLKEWDKCVGQCNLVLADDADNLKALYRRGQALMGTKQWQAAAADLERSLRLSSHDAEQQKLIRVKLQEAKDQISVLRASGALTEEAVVATSSSPAAAGPSGAAAAAAAAPMGSSNDPAVVAKMMAQNPEMAKMAAEQLKSISPEQLEAMTEKMGQQTGMKVSPEMAKMAAESMSKMSPADISRMADMAAAMRQPGAAAPGMGGMPALSPEMMQMATDMMKNMSPEDMQRMSQLSAGMRDGGASAASTASPPAAASAWRSAPSSAAATSSSPASALAPAAAGPSGMPAMTPEMAKMAADMMSKMSPDDMANMSKMMGGAGPGAAGMPAGMPTMTPEMAKMAADMMSNMSAEDMAQMQQMAAGMGVGGPGAAGAGGLGSMMSGDAMSKLSDPKFMESALSMMRGMDPASLSSMMMSSGMCKSQQQADQMAQQMKGMSDTQMKMMLRTANVLQRGAGAVAKTKDFLLSRNALLLALLVILLAVLLRYLGLM